MKHITMSIFCFSNSQVSIRRCSAQNSRASLLLYLQLQVNCDLIQAEIREVTDGCKIRSSFWQTYMHTMQEGGHHPALCATEQLFGGGVHEHLVFQRTSDKVESIKCSFAWIILSLLMVLEAGPFMVSLLKQCFYTCASLSTPLEFLFTFYQCFSLS